MVHEIPKKRPNINFVMAHFFQIQYLLGIFRLSSCEPVERDGSEVNEIKFSCLAQQRRGISYFHFVAHRWPRPSTLKKQSNRAAHNTISTHDSIATQWEVHGGNRTHTTNTKYHEDRSEEHACDTRGLEGRQEAADHGADREARDDLAAAGRERAEHTDLDTERAEVGEPAERVARNVE